MLKEILFGRLLCRLGRHHWTPWQKSEKSDAKERRCMRDYCRAKQYQPSDEEGLW